MSAEDWLALAAALLFLAASLDGARTRRWMTAAGWLFCAALLGALLLAEVAW